MKDRMTRLSRVKRVVVKVGTSSINHPNGRIHLLKIEKLVRQLADLSNRGYEPVLVTSGAIAAGMGKLGLAQRPRTIPEKQAAAAVGQLVLTHLYSKLFSEYGVVIGQILLTGEDLQDRQRFLYARDAMMSLIKSGVIPVVNENDAVNVDEIKVGDNDTLSALVASLVDADLLIILSDVDALYTANPSTDPTARPLHTVEAITDEVIGMAAGAGSALGTGGMATKLSAAEIATRQGIDMLLTSSDQADVLSRLLDGEEIGTLFVADEESLSAKKHWLAFGSRPSGHVVVDAGAEHALAAHKSLLPVGITEVIGDFGRGDIIAITNASGEMIGRGITNYSAGELQTIKGRDSKTSESLLEHCDYVEAIHVDNLSLRRR